MRRTRLLRVFSISAVVGILVAAVSSGALGLFPPRLGKPNLTVAAASTHVFVDASSPSVVRRSEYPVSELIKRAELLGRIMTSDTGLEFIGRRAGIDPEQIGGSARLTADVPLSLSEPESEDRAADIRRTRLPYQINVQARQSTPILDIYVEAPSTAAAVRLGNAAVSGVRDYLENSGEKRTLLPDRRMELKQLGTARGGVVNHGLPAAIVLVSFIFGFALSCGGLLYALRRRDGRPPRSEAVEHRPARDDWPHTTRLLPWTLAGFIAILWLLPFNEIQLTVHLPIDLKLDRLVLPFVAGAWALALAAGGRTAPRLVFTRIHLAIGVFVVFAFLSVIVGARELNRTLELDTALKQLPLLVSYVSLFVIVASAVRRSEVRAFLLYTLGLAVVCALGVVWEYRFKQNLFYDWSDKLLPSFFSVGTLDTTAVDTIGRRMVRGPAALPLETVAMLAMALPVALVSAMQAKEQRHRIIYGVAACVLLAACFATFRKSALLAPVSVIATIAYYRRRELLKLSPLGLVLVVLIHILAPGALGKTTGQFDPAQLGVTTVSSRTADYDAIRPDLWTHLLFGRGWGSYDHVTYRILDSELLRRVLEMGVLGFLAYLFMILSVIGTARATIATRDPVWAPLGLMGAAAAVSFLVVSSLFDVLAFPHATYIFLCTAGLVAVGAKQGQEPAEIAALRRDDTDERDPPPQDEAPAPERDRIATPVGV